MEGNIGSKIQKSVLSVGSKPVTYEDGTKVHFHYKTSLCDEDGTVIDDSRHHDKPLEIIIGKKFKLEIWEICLKTMASGEIASFKVDKSLCGNYPSVAKSLRDIAHGTHEHKHVCGMMSMKDQGGLGYSDLDDLLAKPKDLLFTFEILQVEETGKYEKDIWTMSDDEKRSILPKLKEDGNQLYREKSYEAAADKYAKAIGIIEELMLKEKPNDDPWIELQHLKQPLLLNFSQCRLSLEDYYPVIEHCTTVLDTDPNNVKALYRRAKAHTGAWNPKEAIMDFEKVMELDPSLTKAVKKELLSIATTQGQRDAEDKEKLKGMFK